MRGGEGRWGRVVREGVEAVARRGAERVVREGEMEGHAGEGEMEGGGERGDPGA